MQKFYENFMFSDLTWKKKFVPGNGGSGGARAVYEVLVFDHQILRAQTGKCIAFNNHYFIVSIFISFKCVICREILILFLSYSGHNQKEKKINFLFL